MRDPIARSGPRVSVIVPSFNRARYLGDAIDSVRAQTVDDWECIIVDDGSTDGADRVARKLARSDARVTVHCQHNRGPSAARNVALARASGDWVQFLDADDLLDPTKLERQLSAVEGSEVCVAQCDYRDRFDDPSVDPSREWHVSPRLSPGRELVDLVVRWATDIAPPIHSFLVRRERLAREKILFNESLRAFEDWDFWVRLFSTDPGLAWVPEVLVTYRRHSENATRQIWPMVRGFHAAIRVQREHWRDDPLLRRLIGHRALFLPMWALTSGVACIAPTFAARAQRWRRG